MGNSQSSKKSKKKAKKYESDSEAGDEEVEYEEVEVSVYETVHEESSPKSLHNVFDHSFQLHHSKQRTDL